MRHIVVIGEAVADAFVAPVPMPSQGAHASAATRNVPSATAATIDLRVHPGGSPVNTAVALGRLRTPTRFLGRLSRGVLGEALLGHLAASGVDVSACVRTAEPATLAIAAVDAAGRAAYDFYAAGTADWGWTAEELADRRPVGAACVHAASLALVLEPGASHIEQMLADAREWATISIDPNVRPALVPPTAYRGRLERWINLADVLRLSDEDLAYLAPGASLTAAFNSWHRAGVRLAVVTLGERGAVASLDGAQLRVPAVPVELADTVGAGDSFTGGLLHWLARRDLLGGRLNGLQLDEVADAIGFATRVAAYTCAVPGADPPWYDQVVEDTTRGPSAATTDPTHRSRVDTSRRRGV